MKSDSIAGCFNGICLISVMKSFFLDLRRSKCETHFDPKCTCDKMARRLQTVRQVLLGSHNRITFRRVGFTFGHQSTAASTAAVVFMSPGGNFVVVAEGGFVILLARGLVLTQLPTEEAAANWSRGLHGN